MIRFRHPTVVKFGRYPKQESLPGGVYRFRRYEQPRDYLCFTAEEEGSTIGTILFGASDDLPRLQYSTDLSVWNGFVIGETTVTLNNVGDKVYLRAEGENSRFSYNSNGKYSEIRFVMTGLIAGSGNIMSLLDASCESRVIPNSYCFWDLFYDCSSLTAAPKLPATTLKPSCYLSMFQDCTNLYEAPELPAATLENNCYAEMFSGCTALTTVTDLPATTLAYYCYYNMFYNCSNLYSISVAFTRWSPTNATTYWVYGVPSGGIFICPRTLPDRQGDNNIPVGWEKVDRT